MADLLLKSWSTTYSQDYQSNLSSIPFHSDPQFVRLHLQQQQSSQKLLVLFKPGTPSFHFKSVDYEAAGSSKCNGADAVELYLQLERALQHVPRFWILVMGWYS